MKKKRRKTAIGQAGEFLNKEFQEKIVPKMQRDLTIKALELAMNNLAPDGEAYKACEIALELVKESK